MYQPEAYWIALLFMVTSMMCWGSWANTMKLTPGWHFPLFYWDYVIGIILGSLLWGITLGAHGQAGLSFFADIRQADSTHIVFALLGGAVFNVANLLLVAAIDIAGLAVAFPIGIGLALVVGVLLNFVISPQGNPVLLFGGVLLVLIAIVLDAFAYRRRESTQSKLSARGIQLSVACGVLMGVFYPLVAKAIRGEHSLGPYAVAFFFALGTALCTIPVNYFLMRKPLTGGSPVSMADYFRGKTSWHWWGILGGIIWCTGAVFQFRGLARSNHWTGDFLCHRPGCHDGFCDLGCVRLARVCECSGACPQTDSLDVRIFPGGANCGRSCAHRGDLTESLSAGSSNQQLAMINGLLWWSAQ